MKNKRIKIQRCDSHGGCASTDGSVIVGTVLYGSGDNFTANGADGFLYEINRNIRDYDGAYIAI